MNLVVSIMCLPAFWKVKRPPIKKLVEIQFHKGESSYLIPIGSASPIQYTV